jgi:glutamine synthetase
MSIKKKEEGLEDPMDVFFQEKEETGQVYARVPQSTLKRFQEICKENEISIYRGTEIAFKLLIKKYDERAKPKGKKSA